MERPDNIPLRGGGVHMASVLSLFLILLAFFAMLSGISRFEVSRTRAVLGSLNDRFYFGDPDSDHLMGTAGPVRGAKSVARTLHDTLNTAFGAEAFQLTRIGLHLEIRLPADRLFSDSGPHPHAWRRLATSLALVMKEPPAGVRYRLDTLLPVGARAHLDGAARHLTQAGLPATGLAMGLSPADGGGRHVLLILYTLAEDDPPGDA